MVDTGSETGAIEKSQQEMIENIFEFDDNTAGDVMTHRTDVTAVESDATVTEAAKLAVETGFSRCRCTRRTWTTSSASSMPKTCCGC